MTGFPPAPYPWVIIRLFAATLSAATLNFSLGCATDAATRAELQELRSSLRALRQENGRLEARLEKLEDERSARRPPAAPSVALPAGAGESVPALTVVKLRPKVQPAPKVSTRVEVVEPPDGLVGELKAGPGDPPDEADLAMAEGAYQKGVDALKTGNVEGGMSQLKRFAEEWPKHPRADNAKYFVGLAMMSQQDFAGAAEQFDRIAAQYPAGDAILDSMLKLAECRLRLNQPQEARTTWEKIVFAFPGTAAASQAQTRLAALPQDAPKSLP